MIDTKKKKEIYKNERNIIHQRWMLRYNWKSCKEWTCLFVTTLKLLQSYWLSFKKVSIEKIYFFIQ